MSQQPGWLWLCNRRSTTVTPVPWSWLSAFLGPSPACVSHQPPGKLETAYHRTDKAIQHVVDLHCRVTSAS
jgi:hypothetical protein